MTEKKRLTLTGNKMPEDVYKKLEQLGNERKLTPYIVNLIEKEERMDKLIDGLSILLSRFDRLEKSVDEINNKFENNTIALSNTTESINSIPDEEIKQGKLEISEKIEGGIEEEIPDMDF